MVYFQELADDPLDQRIQSGYEPHTWFLGASFTHESLGEMTMSYFEELANLPLSQRHVPGVGAQFSEAVPDSERGVAEAVKVYTSRHLPPGWITDSLHS
jgi:hypothetical protein